MIARGRAGVALAVALAVVAALVVVPLKSTINTAAGDDIGFLPAMAAVVVAAWLGGFIPGVIATGVSMVLEAYVFMAPANQLEVALASDRTRLALFGLVGILASWLAWLRARAEERAHRARADAELATARVDLTMRRLGALQGLAAELAEALTRDDITDALLTHGIASLQADGAAVFLLEPGDEELVAIAWRGYGRARAEALARIPLDLPLPATDVARTGAPVYIEEPAEYEARYGASLAARNLPVEPRAVAAVPLDLESRRFGVLGFTWGQQHDFPADRRTFIGAIARLGAGALERGQLSDRERAALHRAEAAQRNLDLLAETGRVLGLTLDYEATLRRLAGVALPLMGDLGIVDVLEPDGVRRFVASVDEASAGVAAVLERHPVEPASEGPIAGVLRSADARVFALDEEAVRGAAVHPEIAEALVVVGARWALVAPLRVLGRTIGALTFLRRELRPYDDGEIAVATELGDRAGRAIDNARLHAQVARLADRESRHAAELEAVIGAIGEGIIVTGADGSVRSVNGAAIRLLGGPIETAGDLLGRFREADGGAPRELPRGPAEFQLRDRANAWVEVSTYPVAGSPTTVMPTTVVVCRDVTAFRQGQGLREAFLSLLSHELRTPVTTIYGGSSVLTRPGAAIDAETRDEILADIAGEANRLYRLVEDLLVLARFDEGLELGAEPGLLQHLVPPVVELERVRWPGIRFEVEVAPDLPAVSADETSVQQVLRNLLSNAAKYSGVDALVEVRVEAALDGVAVRVRDHGAGIDPDEAESLFDPFYRSPTTAKMAGGAGIGLYVSRRLVDAMGGRIWASPADGGGSEFTVVLPTYRGDPGD